MTRSVVCVVCTALTSFYNKYYGQCSRAFIKLESLEGVSKEELDRYKKLAVAIFTRNAPKDPPEAKGTPRYKCTSSKCSTEVRDFFTACPDCNKPFAGCLITGRAILTPDTYTCKTCKHQVKRAATSASLSLLSLISPPLLLVCADVRERGAALCQLPAVSCSLRSGQCGRSVAAAAATAELNASKHMHCDIALPI
jgi:hypothetical protein